MSSNSSWSIKLSKAGWSVDRVSLRFTLKLADDLFGVIVDLITVAGLEIWLIMRERERERERGIFQHDTIFN